MASDTVTCKISWRVAAGAAACALSCALAAAPVTAAVAQADPLSELSAVQAQVQEANQAYDDANGKVSELEGQIQDNEERISQIEEQLPGLRERASDSIRVLYKMQQGSGGLIDLVLSSENFFDLVSTIQYLDVIQEHNSDAVDALAAAAEELQQAHNELDAQMKAAEDERQKASDALASANKARADLEAEIAAQAAAEEAARQAALKEAQEEAAQEGSFTTESGNKAEIEVPDTSAGSGSADSGSGSTGSGSTSTPSPDAPPVDWQSDKDAFIAKWTPRINAFMAGSPMAGTGKTFAEAAWEYGVDPRFSPAISAVESSRGAACFKPHNAWGWGNSSWGSWDEAIWAHVAGLASGYGGQLTLAAAQKYCPPNAAAWYSSVLANMNRI